MYRFKQLTKGGKIMNVLVDALVELGNGSTSKTLWWTWDEPACPEELL